MPFKYRISNGSVICTLQLELWLVNVATHIRRLAVSSILKQLHFTIPRLYCSRLRLKFWSFLAIFTGERFIHNLITQTITKHVIGCAAKSPTIKLFKSQYNGHYHSPVKMWNNLSYEISVIIRSRERK